MSDRDVGEWGPGFTERLVGAAEPLARARFRFDVRGLESLPSGGGALIVGNHSGGMLTPDVLIFAAAFYRRFGYQRPLYTLGHHGMFVGPMSGWLGRLGDTHELTDAMANAFCEIHAAAGLSDGIAAVQAAPADATAGVAHAEKGRR